MELYAPDTSRIINDFKKANKFISKYNKTTNVLIHCNSCGSKTTTIILGYLIGKKNLTLERALDKLRLKYGKYCPETNYLN